MWPYKISPRYDRILGRDVDSDTLALTDGEAEKQDALIHSKTPRSSRMQYLREFLFTATSILCFLIVLITAWRTTLHPVPRSVRYEKKTLECGNTTEQAESRGCAFDLLSHNWLPAPCLDPLTEAEYREYVSSKDRKLGPYPYFLDADGKEHIPDERTFALLANGPTLADQHVYTTREEHLAHCQFLLRRTHRAAEGKVRLNDENAQFWHTEHCLGELRHPGRKAMDELNEGFYVGYSPCTIEVPV